jgi:hypothetical protein
MLNEKGAVRVFRQKITLEDTIGSSRVFTPFTGWDCKFRPNTEGNTAIYLINAYARCKQVSAQKEVVALPASARTGVTIVPEDAVEAHWKLAQHIIRYGARFRQKFTLSRMPLVSHTCSLEARMRVANGIPLGCSLLLLVGTVNCTQTPKVPECG